MPRRAAQPPTKPATTRPQRSPRISYSETKERTPITEDSESEAFSDEEEAFPPPTKRTRNLPATTKSSAKESRIEEPISTQPVVEPKRRGRPPKNQNIESAVVKNTNSGIVVSSSQVKKESASKAKAASATPKVSVEERSLLTQTHNIDTVWYTDQSYNLPTTPINYTKDGEYRVYKRVYIRNSRFCVGDRCFIHVPLKKQSRKDVVTADSHSDMPSLMPMEIMVTSDQPDSTVNSLVNVDSFYSSTAVANLTTSSSSFKDLSILDSTYFTPFHPSFSTTSGRHVGTLTDIRMHATTKKIIVSYQLMRVDEKNKSLIMTDVTVTSNASNIIDHCFVLSKDDMNTAPGIPMSYAHQLFQCSQQQRGTDTTLVPLQHVKSDIDGLLEYIKELKALDVYTRLYHHNPSQSVGSDGYMIDNDPSNNNNNNNNDDDDDDDVVDELLAASADSSIDDVDVAAATGFHPGFLPVAAGEPLPRRETEFQTMFEFLEGAVSRNSAAGTLFISGMPGTGKTASLHQVLRRLSSLAQSNAVPHFKTVEINATKLSEPSAIYSLLWFELTGRNASPAVAEVNLTAVFTGKGASILGTQDVANLPFIILVIDELDYLMNRNQDVLYQLVEWPGKSHARLATVGISNTFDLPERLLARVQSRVGLTRLSFNPYSREDLEAILILRLRTVMKQYRHKVEKKDRRLARLVNKNSSSSSSSSGVSDKDAKSATTTTTTSTTATTNQHDTAYNDSGSVLYEGFISDDAVEYISRKVAAVSGDVRRALAIMKRCIHLARPSNNPEHTTTTTTITPTTTVTMDHVIQAIADMYGSSNIALIQQASQLEQVVLMSVLILSPHNIDNSPVNVVDIAEKVEHIYATKGLGEPPVIEAVVDVITRLSRVGLTVTQKTCFLEQSFVSLNVVKDEVVFALKAHDVFGPMI